MKLGQHGRGTTAGRFNIGIINNNTLRRKSCCTPVSVQFVLKRISQHSARSSVTRIANGIMLFLMRNGAFLLKTCSSFYYNYDLTVLKPCSKWIIRLIEYAVHFTILQWSNSSFHNNSFFLCKLHFDKICSIPNWFDNLLF